jgi:hypothetical protein
MAGINEQCGYGQCMQGYLHTQAVASRRFFRFPDHHSFQSVCLQANTIFILKTDHSDSVLRKPSARFAQNDNETKPVILSVAKDLFSFLDCD